MEHNYSKSHKIDRSRNINISVGNKKETPLGFFDEMRNTAPITTATSAITTPKI